MAIKLYNAGNKKSIKDKSFRMKWLLLCYMKIVKENKYLANPLYQIERILAGGYCTPVGNYYNCVNQIINTYDLRRFDKLIEG